MEFKANCHDLYNTEASNAVTAGEFSSLQMPQTDTGAHPATYSTCIGVLIQV
jgi:hypothetical protein